MHGRHQINDKFAVPLACPFAFKKKLTIKKSIWNFAESLFEKLCATPP